MLLELGRGKILVSQRRPTDIDMISTIVSQEKGAPEGGAYLLFLRMSFVVGI
jgi:hypothetical protein